MACIGADATRPGIVVIPNGFGLIYEGTVYGVNIC